MKSFVLFLFSIIFFLSLNSYSQNKNEYDVFSRSANNSAIGNEELSGLLKNKILLSINNSGLKNLYQSRLPEISLTLPGFDNNNMKLVMSRFDILAPGAKIVARTANGNEELDLKDLAVSYKGYIEGMENSLVSLNFTENRVTGIIITGNDNYNIGSLKNKSGIETDEHILFRESYLKVKNDFMCGTEDNLSTEYINEMRKTILKNINNDSPNDLYTAEIAIEIDYATYNTYGQSVTAATNYALALMSASSAIYMKEVNVKLVIPYLRVWTTTDPYPGTNSSAVLNQFRNEWNANQQSVQRTLVHMISRRSGNMGGIAFINTLCSGGSTGYGYGFSNTDGPIQPLPTYSWDVMVVSHEMGHNFGSNHTHNCGWVGGAIDSCYAVEGGCYSGPPVTRVGTIMSYCHLNGSISLVQGFGPQPKALIRSRAENSACMYIYNREIQLGYPNGGESVRTGESRPIYWGTSATGNVNLELSTNNGSTWQSIQNNVPAQQRQFDWIVPYISSTSQCKIRIINSSNPNSGDTCDASFRIILNLNAFNNLSPASFSRISVSPNSTEFQNFSWSSAGTNPTIRYKFKIRKLSTNIDYTYSSNNNGGDTVISIRKSFLDTLANTLGVTGDSVRCTWRSWGYNGIDSIASGNTFIVTLVRTTVGINLLSTAIPEKYNLENNYPNPFNPQTNINFDLPVSAFADLRIYDTKGSEVKTLLSENLQPGSYQVTFNAGNLPSGVYFYRLITNGFSDTKRMILVK
ncbi:MAG: T9SS type A sorting domain-containing protein [Ignavibacteria bacterium]|nr:T9SS type A sorting domain-containing protein [Ignavibacteria bacterium]